MEPPVRVTGISKNFGKFKAVSDLSFEVGAGEIYGLVGPDGAGKTTTLRLICGALGLSAGSVSIAGFDIAGQLPAARAQIGYLSQRFSLYEELTVLENIRFFAEVRSVPRNQWYARCLEILTFVGLAGFLDRRAGNLSGGMKQKLGLATALVHKPRVLLLDEPTTGVDPVTRQDFWQLIIRLAGEESASVLVTTPYMDEAVRCGRIGFMRESRLLVEDTPAGMRSRLAGRIYEISGSPLPLLRRLAGEAPGVEEVNMFGDRIHLRLEAGAPGFDGAAFSERVQQAGGALQDVQAVPAQLEDVFISLVG